MMEELERLNNLLAAFLKFTGKGEFEEFKDLMANGQLTGDKKADAEAASASAEGELDDAVDDLTKLIKKLAEKLGITDPDIRTPLFAGDDQKLLDLGLSQEGIFSIHFNRG